jgi:glucose-6-phosphate isomerase
MIRHQYFNCISIEKLQSKSKILGLKNICEDISTLSNSKKDYYKIFTEIDIDKIEKELLDIANKIRDNFSDVIIIGMGGASLNPKCALFTTLNKDSTTKSNPNIYFLDNTDPIFFESLFNKINIKNTAIIAISNSGGTLETNALVSAVINVFSKNEVKDFSSRFFALTSNEETNLGKINNYLGGTLVQHEKNISGRYSGLSSVSFFPMMIAGLDYRSYIDGANKSLKDFDHRKDKSLSAISALQIFLNDKDIVVNTGYLQQYKPFLDWYSQIISESLGKSGKGYTPISGTGPGDQHSMFQLYLDGKNDKFHNIYYIQKDSSIADQYYYKIDRNSIKEDVMKEDCIFLQSNKNNFSYIPNSREKTDLFTINTINHEAATQALIKQNIPVRLVQLSDLSEKSIGGLVAETMLESVILARLMCINPFNQPAVESIKSGSRKLVG